MDKYKFGRCKECFKNSRPLKNGYCIDCENPVGFFTSYEPPMPDLLKDLFKCFDNNEKKEK